MKTRVVLLDDHEVVRRGVANLLTSQPDFAVVGEAGDADTALRDFPALDPDVAVLDARLPDGNGIDVCRELRSRSPGVRCLILTSYDDEDALVAAVLAGASGYVLKEVRGTGIIDAVRLIAAGRSLIDEVGAESVAAALRRQTGTDPRVAELSAREREVLDLIAQGMTNREIAQTLFLAEKTVKNYVSSLLAKLGMQRRTQAAVLGAQLGRTRGR